MSGGTAVSWVGRRDNTYRVARWTAETTPNQSVGQFVRPFELIQRSHDNADLPPGELRVDQDIASDTRVSKLGHEAVSESVDFLERVPHLPVPVERFMRYRFEGSSEDGVARWGDDVVDEVQPGHGHRVGEEALALAGPPTSGTDHDIGYGLRQLIEPVMHVAGRQQPADLLSVKGKSDAGLYTATLGEVSHSDR